MQYGCPLPQAETRVMVSLHWSFQFFSPFYFIFAPLSLLVLCTFHLAAGESGRDKSCLYFSVSVWIQAREMEFSFSHQVKKKPAFEENLLQSITVELIAKPCQHKAFSDLALTVTRVGSACKHIRLICSSWKERGGEIWRIWKIDCDPSDIDVSQAITGKAKQNMKGHRDVEREYRLHVSPIWCAPECSGRQTGGIKSAVWLSRW